MKAMILNNYAIPTFRLEEAVGDLLRVFNPLHSTLDNELLMVAHEVLGPLAFFHYDIELITIVNTSIFLLLGLGVAFFAASVTPLPPKKQKPEKDKKDDNSDPS